MKRILLSVAVLSAVGLSAQSKAPAVKTSKAVGIQTNEPRATLDVNGNARFQKLELMKTSAPTQEVYSDCPCVLTVDKFGVVKRIPQSKFVLSDGSSGGSGSGGSVPGGGSRNGFVYNGKFYDDDKYVKDQKFGDGKHDFIYKVITGPGGKKWLNNNLGADYANVHSNVFNPNQQAKAKDDYHAYGSLFQWGRVDNTGYELVHWTSSTDGTRVRPNAGWKSDSQLLTFTDPCPSGYHTPSMEEWQDFHQAVTDSRKSVSNNKIWSDTKLNLAAAGEFRNNDSSFNYSDSGRDGNYWSSSPNSSRGAYLLYFYHSNSDPEGTFGYRSYGRSVRCLKD